MGVLQHNTESDDSFHEDPLWLQRDKEKVYLREIKKDLVIRKTWNLSIYGYITYEQMEITKMFK